MSKYGYYGDTPNQIQIEGQDITLTRTNTGPNSVRLSWNIPDSVIGCGPNGTYDGIVLTVNRVPASATNSPVSLTRYTADSTADADLHAGDSIKGALVVGAFYNDNTTTELDVSDVDNTEAYYFSAYAVTKELKYHSAGVHSYEQPYGTKDVDGSTAGYHEVQVGFQPSNNTFDIMQYNGTVSGIRGSDVTGLRVDRMYTINGIEITQLYDINNNPIDVYDAVGNPQLRVFNTIGQIIPLFDSVGTLIPQIYDGTGNLITQIYDVDGNPINQIYEFRIQSDLHDEATVTVNGENAFNFDDLVDEINNQLTLLDSPLMSAGAPNAGSLYVNVATKQLYVFDGEKNIEQTLIVDSTDPSVSSIDDHWNDQGTIKKWDGSNWIIQPQYHYHKDPTAPTSTDYWIDGTNAYGWEGATWCKRPFVNGVVDPSLPPMLMHGTYWYDENELVVKKLNSDGCWTDVEVILSATDINALPDNHYWFNEAAYTMHVKLSGVWSEVQNVVYSPNDPITTVAGMVWYRITSSIIRIRNLTNDGWDEFPVIEWPSDPELRESCNLWWNETTDLLYVWNVVHSRWDLAANFIQSDIDPSLAVEPDVKTLWFDGVSLNEWDGTMWNLVTFINHPTDPTAPMIGEYRYDTTTSGWFNWNGAAWATVNATLTATDPYAPVAGDFWFNPSTLTLNRFNGMSWIALAYSNAPSTPKVGFRYYDTLVGKLLEWDGVKYVNASAFANVGITEAGNLVFLSKTLGSESFVCIADETLFSSLTLDVRYPQARYGTDAIPTGGTTHEIGVGTDGSSDERRELADTIKAQLGYPVVEVELTKQQLDLCIDGAIESLRKRASSAYTHAYFFLDVEPGVQHYELSSKRVGFNKIVDVQSAHRVQSSFLGNAYGQGAYGQAMLQQLYQMGTFDLVSYHLVSEYVETMNIMFANHLTFHWQEQKRMLSFYQSFGTHERVLIAASIERTEQELINDRMLKTWIERYAMGSAKILLGQIRGKYSNLPGAGGGVGLNAQELLSSGQQDIEICWQQIDDFVIDQPEEYGYESTMMLG